MMRNRSRLAVSLLLLSSAPCAFSGEVLYNGIQLPDQWPPHYERLEQTRGTPPYLNEPPSVIPIDVGRQLFVDDFLIDDTSLTRTHHRPTYHPDNPVLQPDQPWEREVAENPTAMPYSDGVFYDPHDGLFKMWYMGGYVKQTCYATSRDGVHWEKPSLDVVPGTNVVHAATRDSTAVWLDQTASDPQQRFKMVSMHWPTDYRSLFIYTSPDGIHWSQPLARTPATELGDRHTAFYNPFRKVWVYSIRGDVAGVGRMRRYREHPDFLEASQWKEEPAVWTGADPLDVRWPELAQPPQLYALDCVAYESLLIGLFSIWHGERGNRPKLNDVCIGYSRDGFHWSRPDRSAFLPTSDREGDWNLGNVQTTGGCCLIVGDQLNFYVSGRKGVPNSRESGACSTGLATMRRDGFVSLDAGDVEGSLTTRVLKFSGKRLFVNVNADQGELTAELLDEAGKVIEPCNRANCVPVTNDKSRQPVTWKGAEDLAFAAGKPVRLRFFLKNAQLYSFWISPDDTGASHGYVAAGGPGFTGITDTVGEGVGR